jgi:hypothetical protein
MDHEGLSPDSAAELAAWWLEAFRALEEQAPEDDQA